MRLGDTDREGEGLSGGSPGSPPLKYDEKVPFVRSFDLPGPPAGDMEDRDCACWSFFGGACSAQIGHVSDLKRHE